MARFATLLLAAGVLSVAAAAGVRANRHAAFEQRLVAAGLGDHKAEDATLTKACPIEVQQSLIGTFSPAMFACDYASKVNADLLAPLRQLTGETARTQPACSATCTEALAAVKPVDAKAFSCIGEPTTSQLSGRLQSLAGCTRRLLPTAVNLLAQRI
jgi:hypothetical protein